MVSTLCHIAEYIHDPGNDNPSAPAGHLPLHKGGFPRGWDGLMDKEKIPPKSLV